LPWKISAKRPRTSDSTAPDSEHAPTPEEARASAARSLAEPGRERLRLVARLEEVDKSIRPLVAQAVAAGLPYRRIAELTGVSRATVGRWVKT
jgi:DNA-directed RNA polymerase specialized sigma24 family protein